LYRYAGLRRRLKLGHYPELDLENARKKARNALNEVEDGNDPAQQKKDKRAEALRERLEAKTFAELSARYIEEYAKPNKRTWQEDVRILDKHLLPEFGRLNVKDITRSHIRLYLRQMALKTRVHSNRIHATIRKMFNWAMNEEIIELESNPAAGITRPGGKERPKERTLTDGEIKTLWGALEKMSPQIRDVLRLILLTGQRPGEVMGMRWDEIDFEEALWTLPGSRTKNGISNVVPLSPQAIRIIERHAQEEEEQRQRREKRSHDASTSMFVFPNKKLKKRDEPVVHVRKATGRIWRATGIASFSAHDLRRTCATRLGQMEIPGHVIARILNHKQMDITSMIYNKYQYLKEKREALDAWGARLVRIVSNLELVESQDTGA